MRSIKIGVFCMLLLFCFFNQQIVAQPYKRFITKKVKIKLTPKSDDFTKKDFIKTVIILKKRLRDSKAKFKLTTTTNYKIKIVFKRKQEYNTFKDLIFTDFKMSKLTIDTSSLITNNIYSELTNNNINASIKDKGVFFIKSKKDITQTIDSIFSNKKYQDKCLVEKIDTSQVRVYMVADQVDVAESIKEIKFKSIDNEQYRNVLIGLDEKGLQFMEDKGAYISLNNKAYLFERIDSANFNINVLKVREAEALKLFLLYKYGDLPLQLKKIIKP